MDHDSSRISDPEDEFDETAHNKNKEETVTKTSSMNADDATCVSVVTSRSRGRQECSVDNLCRNEVPKVK